MKSLLYTLLSFSLSAWADSPRVHLRIFKEERVLELWKESDGRFALEKTYPICRFSGTLGPKTRKGDHQAPEGFYELRASSLNPHSAYHLALNVGYPNAYDRHWKRTGSAIMIHGDCVSIGCFAMGDAAIEEVYAVVEASLKAHPGESVATHIFPFRMTAKNLIRHRASRWREFWEELRPAYEAFEKNRQPPRVELVAGRYRLAEANVGSRPRSSHAAWIAGYMTSYTARPGSSLSSVRCQRALAVARRLPEQVTRYVAAYQGLSFPNGDVSATTGVCTDVLVRSLRGMGIDLQTEINADMKRNLSAYPNLWGQARPDPNIDHRRVPNIMVYLGRTHHRESLEPRVGSYQACDVVAWDLGGGVTHIGLVMDRVGPRGLPLVVHHLSGRPVIEDFLDGARIIGHYRLR